MYILHIELKAIMDEMDAGFSKPSLIKISILDQFLMVVKEIVCAKWGAEIVLEWFVSNKESLLNEFLFIQVNEGRSIAATIHEFYEDIDPEDFDSMDRMLAYRESHGLRFALRGVDIPDVYIGKKRDGIYEVSCVDIHNCWMFEVDLPAFFDKLAALEG